ncbi:MAG TPA: hypothetical protein VK688_08690, partial [Gemmatimonadales bacterium]|nr:hypothetical protein [Gemmatimonadales bacterium]
MVGFEALVDAAGAAEGAGAGGAGGLGAGAGMEDTLSGSIKSARKSAPARARSAQVDASSRCFAPPTA